MGIKDLAQMVCFESMKLNLIKNKSVKLSGGAQARILGENIFKCIKSDVISQSGATELVNAASPSFPREVSTLSEIYSHRER